MTDATTDAEFSDLTGPYRQELLSHCYRILGSVHDAEDLVQETYVRAWHGFGGFEGRSSLRVWLYTIATRACLTALRQRARRPLPSGLGPGVADPSVELSAAVDVVWLQPAPDAMLIGSAADPATVAVQRESIRLAFVAALQHLSPRQRAVLILREVVMLRADEVAAILQSTPGAVHSTLRRAHLKLSSADQDDEGLLDPDAPAVRELLTRYVLAFQAGDVASITRLLRDDVALEMPPFALWFRGRETVASFLSEQVLDGHHRWRVLATRANDQPAAVVWHATASGAFRPHGVQVLEVRSAGISRIVSFNDPALVAVFAGPVVGAFPDAGPGINPPPTGHMGTAS